MGLPYINFRSSIHAITLLMSMFLAACAQNRVTTNSFLGNATRLFTFIINPTYRTLFSHFFTVFILSLHNEVPLLSYHSTAEDYQNDALKLSLHDSLCALIHVSDTLL